MNEPRSRRQRDYDDVGLDELLAAGSGPAQPCQHARHPRSPRNNPWICVATRVLDGWAATLRATVLILAAAVCLFAAIGAAWGVLVLMAPVVLGIAMTSRTARRLLAMPRLA